MNADLVLELMLLALNQAAKMGAMISQARAEGRDISDAELDGLRAADDAAKLKFQARIDAVRAP